MLGSKAHNLNCTCQIAQQKNYSLQIVFVPDKHKQMVGEFRPILWVSADAGDLFERSEFPWKQWAVQNRTKFLCVSLLTNKEILALFYRAKPATEMKRSVIEGTAHVRNRRRSKMGEIDVSAVVGWHGHHLQIAILNCAIWQVLEKLQAFDTRTFY